MIQFFQSIAGFIETVVDYVVSFFRNLILLITMIPKALVAVSAVLNLFPPFIVVPIVALIFLSLIIAILNKWG